LLSVQGKGVHAVQEVEGLWSAWVIVDVDGRDGHLVNEAPDSVSTRKIVLGSAFHESHVVLVMTGCLNGIRCFMVAHAAASGL
jgi:hypothetical protein